MDVEWVIVQLYRKKLTRKQLARGAKMSREHLSRLLNGKRPWTPDTEARIRRVLTDESREDAAA